MKNDFLEMMKTRRSIRAYKPDAVPEELLSAVLEAGTYAPTGRGKQSPVIIAITDKEVRERISKLNAAVMGRTATLITERRLLYWCLVTALPIPVWKTAVVYWKT